MKINGKDGYLALLKGDPNTLTIGTVESGDTPSATITGEAPNQTLNLVLPKGDKGDKGDAGGGGECCYINGVATSVNFTSDPQAQIDEINEQVANTQTLAYTNLQQIEALKTENENQDIVINNVNNSLTSHVNEYEQTIREINETTSFQGEQISTLSTSIVESNQEINNLKTAVNAIPIIENELSFILNGTYVLQSDIDDILNGAY